MKSIPVEKWALTGEQLHGWYLEAVKGLQPGSFNQNANKPYSEMTEEQKSIDSYIAYMINETFSKAIQAAVEEERKRIGEELSDQAIGAWLEYEWGEVSPETMSCLEAFQTKVISIISGK